MGHRYVLVDVFTREPFAGNPLAVFPDGGLVPDELMPRVARELNLSETVFVLPAESPGHTCRLRIFTPAAELPFAGHPTVGTACVLVSLGLAPLDGGEARLVFEEGVGPVRVTVREATSARAARFDVPRLPEPGPAAPAARDIARVLTLAQDDVLDGELRPRAFSAGVPFLFVSVRDRGALALARIDPAAWEEILSRFWAPSVYVITRDAERPGSTLRARMFAPAMGVAEDPATGAAASALPGYLAAGEPAPDGTLAWRIEQGFEMGRPSLIDVEAETKGGSIAAVRVGGECVEVGEGVLRF